MDEVTTHIEAELALAVEGARRRLELAKQTLDDFHAMHRTTVSNEHHALLVELDDVRRHFFKSVQDLAELRSTVLSR